MTNNSSRFEHVLTLALAPLGVGVEIIRHALLLSVILGCDPDDNLRYLPEPDAGQHMTGSYDAGTIWHEPEPDAGGSDCGLELIWPDDIGPPQGDCAPGWLDTCTGIGAPPLLPTPMDTNCDGISDDQCSPWAMLLVLDTSGSMTTWMPRVEDGACTLSPRGDATRAIVAFGGRWPDHVWSVTGWGQNMCMSLPRGSGEEYAGDAAARAAGLVGGWPAGHARMVVIVTDEPPQHRGLGDGTPELIAACLAQDFRVAVVTREPYIDRYSEVVATCGGYTALLDNDDVTYAMSGAEPPCVVAP